MVDQFVLDGIEILGRIQGWRLSDRPSIRPTNRPPVPLSVFGKAQSQETLFKKLKRQNAQH